LVSVSTIDASQLPDPQWGGKQMLAVYARPEVLLRIGDEIAQSGGDLLGQYGRQHDDMEKLRTELTFTIKQRNELGFQLEAAKDAHDKAEKEHEKKALAAQQRIESYQREVDDQKQRLEMQAAQVDALQRESKALQDVWQRESLALQEALHVCQEALQQSKDEIAALRSEIQAVYASRSWRATAPLRAISRRIKN